MRRHQPSRGHPALQPAAALIWVKCFRRRRLRRPAWRRAGPREARHRRSSPCPARSRARRGRHAARPAAHQREAETRAAGLAVVAVVDLAERREDLVELLARDAGAIVLYGNLEAAAARQFGTHRDAAAFGRELDRVGAEVDQDLLERALIRVERRRRGIDLDGERLLALARLGADQLSATSKVRRASRGCGAISILPASILATSSRSLIRLSRWAPEEWMSPAYSL